MGKESGSFVMYSDYMQHLELLSMEQRGVFITAVMAYASGAELPEMDGMVKMAFSFTKAQMDRDSEQYRKTLEARKEAGKQGGRPKANGFSEKQKKAKKANGFSEKQKNPDTDNVTDNDTDTDTVTDSVNTFCPESETAPDRIAASFRLNDGSLYNVAENDAVMYQQLYPGIDCRQALRNIVGWCDANPTRRKTRSGAKRFINGWLAKAQNSAKPAKKEPQNQFNNFSQREHDYDELERQLLERG